jgi:excisionase family DNA binding protein
MDIRQAAFYLGIATDTLYHYAANGLIPAFKLGNRWRFKRSLLDAWIVEKSNQNTEKKSGQASVSGN